MLTVARFVSLLSRACVSVPALILFSLLILRVDLRFLHEVGYLPFGLGSIDPQRFHDAASPLAIRLVTVGVLILERHDILEIVGAAPKGSARDALSSRIHPFGTFLLVFGLFMECAIEQVHLPTGVVDPRIAFAIAAWAAYAVAVICLLANLQLLQILVSHAWRQRAEQAHAA